MKISFLGSPPQYSQIVKQTLIKAGYQLTDQASKSDLLVVAAHGKILSQKDLEAPNHGTLNLHPSLLPLYRGATPIPHALLNQDKETGITIIKMVKKIDAGPILAQQKVSISPTDNAQTLLLKCFTLGAKILIDIIPKYIDKSLTPKPQPQKYPASMTYKLKKQDGFIKWQEFTKHLTNNFLNLEPKIKAYYPWPGVYTHLPNNKILKILPENKLQIEGKQPIVINQFLAGYQHLLE